LYFQHIAHMQVHMLPLVPFIDYFFAIAKLVG
jgi:hypothetical protein